VSADGLMVANEVAAAAAAVISAVEQK